MDFCPTCGRKLNVGARFCPGCGRAIQAVQPPPTRSVRPKGQTYWQPTKVRWFIAILASGAAALLSIFALLMAGDAIQKIDSFSANAAVLATNEISGLRFVAFSILVLLAFTLILSTAGFRDNAPKGEQSP